MVCVADEVARGEVGFGTFGRYWRNQLFAVAPRCKVVER